MKINRNVLILAITAAGMMAVYAAKTTCYNDDGDKFYCPWGYQCNKDLDSNNKCTVPVDGNCCSEADKESVKGTK
jgi:hypothetical protein